MPRALPAGDAVLVRTDFSDDAAWRAIAAAATRANAEGFAAGVQLVDDAAWAGATAQDVREAHTKGDERAVAFLVDATTVAAPDRPILCVSLEGKKLKTLRVVPGSLASVENNLSIGNLDWRDFARSLDAGGVFRGFPA